MMLIKYQKNNLIILLLCLLTLNFLINAYDFDECTNYEDSIPENFESLPDINDPPPELNDDSPQYKLYLNDSTIL